MVAGALRIPCYAHVSVRIYQYITTGSVRVSVLLLLCDQHPHQQAVTQMTQAISRSSDQNVKKTNKRKNVRNIPVIAYGRNLGRNSSCGS